MTFESRMPQRVLVSTWSACEYQSGETTFTLEWGLRPFMSKQSKPSFTSKFPIFNQACQCMECTIAVTYWVDHTPYGDRAQDRQVWQSFFRLAPHEISMSASRFGHCKEQDSSLQIRFKAWNLFTKFSTRSKQYSLKSSHFIQKWSFLDLKTCCFHVTTTRQSPDFDSMCSNLTTTQEFLSDALLANSTTAEMRDKDLMLLLLFSSHYSRRASHHRHFPWQQATSDLHYTQYRTAEHQRRSCVLVCLFAAAAAAAATK